jgi:hypothetical protein
MFRREHGSFKQRRVTTVDCGRPGAIHQGLRRHMVAHYLLQDEVSGGQTAVQVQPHFGVMRRKDRRAFRRPLGGHNFAGSVFSANSPSTFANVIQRSWRHPTSSAVVTRGPKTLQTIPPKPNAVRLFDTPLSPIKSTT